MMLSMLISPSAMVGIQIKYFSEPTDGKRVMGAAAVSTALEHYCERGWVTVGQAATARSLSQHCTVWDTL